MSTNSDPQSSSLPSFSWVPGATQDSASTLSTSTSYPDWFSGSDSPTSSWTWIETDLPTAAGLTSAGPPLTSTFIFSTLSSSLTVMTVVSTSTSPFPLIETQTSQLDSTSQNAKGPAVKLRAGHIVAISIVTFAVIVAMAILFVYVTRVRLRKLGHQQLYSGPDENFNDDSSTLIFLGNIGRNGGGEAFDFSAAIGMRGRTGSIREHMPSQVLKRWYRNERRSLSDSEACPILRPSLSQSDSPVSAGSTERETSSLGLNESPTIQSWSSILLGEDSLGGPLSPLDPPRYSQVPRIQPIIRPPRPLPVPRNPRPLLPQRRVDSIQVRKQNKPPLIPSSSTSLPLPSSPPSSASGLRNTSVDGMPSLWNFPPLLPQRRTGDSTQIPPLSWTSSNLSLTPLAPLRPTPAVSYKHIPE